MRKTFRVAWLACLGLAVFGEDRVPVPHAAMQKEAEQLVKEVFTEEYTKTKPEEKAALAGKLLKQADGTKDDLAAKYVLWREASALAAQGGDVETALAAVDQMAAVFAVDAVALKKTVLTTVGSVTRDAELSRALGAMKNLIEKPDDPAANLAVGRYLCFAKNDWAKGLPLLARSAVPGLKAAAETDLATPKDAQGQLAAGDSWWDLAEKETDRTVKAGYLSRGTFWYRRALPSLTGFAKVKAEKRLAAAASEASASRGPRPEAIFMAKKSMKLYPKGQKWGIFPAQETDDATAPFTGKPVYFDQRTGKDVVYAVRSAVPLRQVRWRGAAMTNMAIEVQDLDGSVVAKGGPHEGGNVWGEFTLDFEPRTQFYLRFRNHVSTWYLIAELELK